MRREHANAILAGAAAGLAGGFFGVGGGIVMIPLLTGYLALTQHQAHGTSLAVIGVTALVSLIVYALHGDVAWTTAAVVAVASLVTARLGARLAARSSARGLTRAFAVFLVVVAARLLWQSPAGVETSVHGAGQNLAFDLALGLAVGFLSGFMGVGGGILLVPAFTILLGMPQHLAQGTSLAVILVVAPAGAWEHARHGNLVGRLVPALSIGAAIAGPIAAGLALALDRALLSRAFAVFLLVNAISAWIKASRSASAPKP